VLSTPPAFILSQDQTLRYISNFEFHPDSSILQTLFPITLQLLKFLCPTP
jgi:hypothetical protein